MEALFITREDITRLTAMGGSVDVDKYIQFVKIAQDLHIKKFLGERLFDKFQDLISTGDIDNPNYSQYKWLLDVHIKYMTIHWSMVEFLPFASYTIGNKGVYKHTSDTGEVVSLDEVNGLIDKERDIAQSYTTRFIAHIVTSGNAYPEYYTNTNGDMYPTTKNNFNGWHL
jgi:hypothetical protein